MKRIILAFLLAMGTTAAFADGPQWGNQIITSDTAPTDPVSVVEYQHFVGDDVERRLSGVQHQITVLHAKNTALEKRVIELEKKVTILIRMKALEHEKVSK